MLCAGALVQAVDVLRDQREARTFTPAGEHVVRRVGRALAIAVRRQSYHSHTSCGFMANASGVARSSARNCRHNPSSPRKVGMPLADDTPAPVKTTVAFDERRREISSSVSTGIVAVNRGAVVIAVGRGSPIAQVTIVLLAAVCRVRGRSRAPS